MGPSQNQMNSLQNLKTYSYFSDYPQNIDTKLQVEFYHKYLHNLNKFYPFFHSMRFPLNNQNPPPGKLRFFQATPDISPVDVYINGNRVFKNFNFKDVSDYLSLLPGKYQVDIFPSGQSTSAFISKKIRIESGEIQTVVSVGSAANLSIVPFDDQQIISIGESTVRFIHLCRDAPAVDISISRGKNVFRNLSFKTATEYLPLSTMRIHFVAKVAGTKNTFLAMDEIIFESKKKYSILFVGTVKGEPPIDVLMINDSIT